MKMTFRKLLTTVAITITVINMTGCESKEEKIASTLTECAEKYGLEDIFVEVPELRRGYTNYITVYASNYKEIEWDKLFEMHQEMDNKAGGESVTHKDKEKQASYYLVYSSDKIVENIDGLTITYNGSWDSFEIEDSAEHNKKVQEGLKNYSEKLKDEQIGKQECVICGKESTKRIDNEYLCDEHYESAIEYYSNPSDKK